jgi:hypothetical protein
MRRPAFSLRLVTGRAIGARSHQNLDAGTFGWGGRIRTFTVLINSEVSYQLDHAPVDLSE